MKHLNIAKESTIDGATERISVLSVAIVQEVPFVDFFHA